MIPKKVDSFPEIVYLSISQQNHPITLKTFKTPKTFSTRNLHIRKFCCIFEGTLILEATAKNVAYDNKNEFFLHIYIFFSTFAKLFTNEDTLGNMKIVILGTAWPYRGGLAAFNERLAKQFVLEGHEVEVLTFTLQYPSFLFPGKTQFSQESAPQGITIRRAIHSCNPLNWLRVGKQLQKEAPDMVISCYWMAFFAPCYGIIQKLVKKNGKTHCIALVHNMMPHEPSILDKILAPFYVKQTDGFVALSDSVVKDIAKLDELVAAVVNFVK